MSKRGNERRETIESKTIRFLRGQAKLSLRQAQLASGINSAVIAHIEQGRIVLGDRHLEKLLMAYSVGRLTFEMFTSGQITLPRDLARECAEMLKLLSEEQLLSIEPILKSMSGKR